MNGDHPTRLEIAEQIREKLSQRPLNVDSQGFSDLDRTRSEQAERNRNDGWTEAEIVDAKRGWTEAEFLASTQPAQQPASPTGMRPNPAQGGSAGGTRPAYANTVEGRLRQQVIKTKFDEGGGSR